jgi:soluble P-type ATPase
MFKKVIEGKNQLRDINVAISVQSGNTLKETAKIYGLSTPERSRQIHGRMMRKVLGQLDKYQAGCYAKVNQCKEYLDCLIAYRDFFLSKINDRSK